MAGLLRHGFRRAARAAGDARELQRDRADAIENRLGRSPAPAASTRVFDEGERMASKRRAFVDRDLADDAVDVPP